MTEKITVLRRIKSPCCNLYTIIFSWIHCATYFINFFCSQLNHTWLTNPKTLRCILDRRPSSSVRWVVIQSRTFTGNAKVVKCLSVEPKYWTTSRCGSLTWWPRMKGCTFVMLKMTWAPRRPRRRWPFTVSAICTYPYLLKIVRMLNIILDQSFSCITKKVIHF